MSEIIENLQKERVIMGILSAFDRFFKFLLTRTRVKKYRKLDSKRTHDSDIMHSKEIATNVNNHVIGCSYCGSENSVPKSILSSLMRYVKAIILISRYTYIQC